MAFSTSLPSVAVFLRIFLAITGDIWVQAEYGSKICKTIHHPTYSEVNCSGNSLTHIPWDLHSNIKILDLSNNKIETLSNGVFTKYKTLEKLYLRNNAIYEIEPEAFSKLDVLKALDLSSNKLRKVPTESLNLPKLSMLSLQGNRLSGIENGAFKGLPLLKILHLDGNHIRSIKKDAFEGLDYLQTLEIQNNALQYLDQGVMQHCGYSLLTLRMYRNPWFCDCRIHWLKSWLENETHSIRWEFPNFKPTCDGPSSVRDEGFSEVPLEHFACPPEMYSSSDNVVLMPGDSTELFCKYYSKPEIKPQWFKNGELIDRNSAKYVISEQGQYEKSSVLKLMDFQEEDIARYTCKVKNIRGSDSIVFAVTLEGVDINTYFTSPMPEPLGAGVDMKSVVISVAVICGFVLLVVSIILVVCLSSRYKRNKAMRKQEIAKEIKDHFLTNGDLSMKSLDNLDDNESMTNSNNDSNNTKEKLSEQDVTNYLNTSLSNICRPSSPNGHTYMSFDSELTDNDELTQIYSAIRSPRHDGSHTESTTPLLDHYAPSSSIYDSREPLENTSRLQSFSSVPRQGSNYYWSNNHIPRTPGSTRSNTIYNDPSYLYGTNPYHRNYGHYGDYRDYRDYRYPTTTPPMPRIYSTKKSASVGNLGIPQRTPAPRKPPRVNRSGERMSDSVDDTYSEIGRTMNNSSFRGITPGTPV